MNYLMLMKVQNFEGVEALHYKRFAIKTIARLINKQASLCLSLLLINSVLVQLIDRVELKEDPLEPFTHEMELFLRKPGIWMFSSTKVVSYHF